MSDNGSQPASTPDKQNPARSLDAHVDRYAQRTAGMTASEIRALFAVASRPEVVSLAGGMPNLAALPLDSLAAEVSHLVAQDGQVALQYGSAHGVPQLREQICEIMALEAATSPNSPMTAGPNPKFRASANDRVFQNAPNAQPTSAPARQVPATPRSRNSPGNDRSSTP